MSGEERAIEIEELLPHRPEVVWRVLTEADMISRWLMKTDFVAEPGREFSFRAEPMGDWDGTVRCRVLELEPGRRLIYSWVGGSASNPDYGSALSSTVEWTLVPEAGGTRLRFRQSGFRMPENAFAFEAMSKGWGTVMARIAKQAAAIAG